MGKNESATQYLLPILPLLYGVHHLGEKKSELPAIAPWEKSCGKHPTQKPLALLVRILLASTERNAWILDPFAGSSTTGIAAHLTGRRYLGIEREQKFVEMSQRRREELEDYNVEKDYCNKLKDLSFVKTEEILCEGAYGDLPF